MKRVLLLLFLPASLLVGCGGSSQADNTPFCQSVSTVKADVDNLKALRKDPSLGVLQSSLTKLQTDVHTAVTHAKSTAKPKVNALQSSMKTLKVTLQEVKNRSMTVSAATPVIKAQAQVVSENWQALKTAMRCS